jgi:type 4 prepilin peptidase 1 (EC:3.4.23.43). Aspartic peptidase. MEROPS family A24A
MLDLFALGVAFVFGACVGSFVNVVVYRLPAGLSLVKPPSRCPSCLTPLKPQDNIPILGWLLIGGRCRYCKATVSWRYPAIELVTGLMFALVVAQFGQSVAWVGIVGFCLFLSWLLSLALIDLDTMTLPDSLTQSGLIAGLLLHQITAIAGLGNPILQTATAPLNSLVFAVAGAVLGIWLLDIVRGVGSFWLGVEAMGAGDPRLASMIGAWLGWERVLLTILLASALGAVGGIGAVALRRLGKRQPLPFGPFLAMGATLSLFFGGQILNTYLGWFGLT